MINEIVTKILEINKQIENLTMNTTPFFEFGKQENLNFYDKQILCNYQEILNLIIKISKIQKITELKEIDNLFFNTENTASEMIHSYLELLQFYKNINNEITKKEINVINQIQENLKLDDELENENIIELADCYFKLGNEQKARKIILNFIKNNPDEDEAYMCMQNWYMYDKPNIDKLAEVIDLAKENEHILLTDFGYDELINFYKNIGDIKNEEKYQKLYDKWKKDIENN